MGNQQVGSLWQGDWILSTSLSGEINYLDKNTGKVSHSISGHAKAITALAITQDDTLYTGSYDGRVCAWSLGEEGDQIKAVNLGGECHSNLVVGLEADGDRVFSAGMDDMVRVVDASSKSFRYTVIVVGHGNRTDEEDP